MTQPPGFLKITKEHLLSDYKTASKFKKKNGRGKQSNKTLGIRLLWQHTK
jgi:hypothetical protein